MNKAEEFDQKVIQLLKEYSLDKVDQYFKDLKISKDNRDKEYYKEIYRQWEHYPCWYYWYLACATKLLKPKSVVEIGADKGASTLMIMSELPEGGMVYSIDSRLGWEFLPTDTPKIVRLNKHSTDSSLQKIVDFGNVGLWLIDGDHSNETTLREYETYKPYWKNETVILFDDIDAYSTTWGKIKEENTNTWEDPDVHGNNFGILIYE